MENFKRKKTADKLSAVVFAHYQERLEPYFVGEADNHWFFDPTGFLPRVRIGIAGRVRIPFIVSDNRYILNKHHEICRLVDVIG